MGPGSPVPAPEEGPEEADHREALEARGRLTAAERFRPANRLAREQDIRRCLARGRRYRTEHLELIWTENAAGHPRMGLIVPKFQSTAVARNRLRRRLREAWRRRVQPGLAGFDVVIRARRAAYQAGFDALERELLAWRGAAVPAG